MDHKHMNATEQTHEEETTNTLVFFVDRNSDSDSERDTAYQKFSRSLFFLWPILLFAFVGFFSAYIINEFSTPVFHTSSKFKLNFKSLNLNENLVDLARPVQISLFAKMKTFTQENKNKIIFTNEKSISKILDFEKQVPQFEINFVNKISNQISQLFMPTIDSSSLTSRIETSLKFSSIDKKQILEVHTYDYNPRMAYQLNQNLFQWLNKLFNGTTNYTKTELFKNSNVYSEFQKLSIVPFFKEIQIPQKVSHPMTHHKKWIYLTFCLIGSLMGLLLAQFLYSKYQVVQSEEDIEKQLKIPVLGVIPKANEV